MKITNEEIKSHLNYPKPSDVTSMNIKSQEIDSQFHWRQFHNFRVRFVCIRLGGRGWGGRGGAGGVGWGGVRLGISGFRLWNHDLGFYKKTGNQKKKFQYSKLRPRISWFPLSTDFWTNRERIRYALVNSALQWSFAVLFLLIMHARARPLFL